MGDEVGVDHAVRAGDHGGVVGLAAWLGQWDGGDHRGRLAVGTCAVVCGGFNLCWVVYYGGYGCVCDHCGNNCGKLAIGVCGSDVRDKVRAGNCRGVLICGH